MCESMAKSQILHISYPSTALVLRALGRPINSIDTNYENFPLKLYASHTI